MRKLITTPAAALVAACQLVGTGGAWTLSTRGASEATLAFEEPPGAAVLAMACREPGPQMVLTAARFAPVSSNEEFAFGTARDSHLFVADVVGAEGPGVTARGAIPPGLLDDMLATGAVTALYGGERLGPLAPPREQLAAFVAACRALL